jgi:hypothetical protein
VEWVRDYSSLSDTELTKVIDEKTGRRRFPTLRPGKRKVGYGALMSRIRVFRSWLGIAVHVLKIAPSKCTPERVFGTRFEDIALELRDQWERRAAAGQRRVELGLPPLGKAQHAASSGLHNTMALAGVIALLAYDRSRHERRLSLADYEGHEEPGQRVNRGKLRVARHQTAAEASFAEAYNISRTLSEQIVSNRGGMLVTTNKDKAVVFDDIPTMDLIPAALDEIQRRIRAKQSDDGLPFEALRTFLAAIIASGAVRLEECAHMRDDVHFDAKRRSQGYIFLRAVDRKGDYCDHVVPLIEELTPRWLVDYVMDVARPALMAKWTGAGNAPHHFIFMNARGRPFGDPRESADGLRRDARLIATRKGKLQGIFLDLRYQELRRAGLPAIIAHGSHGPHGDRGRVGNICRNTGRIGAERGGQLLGHAGQTTVDRSYAVASAEAHRAILREVLRTRPWYVAREVATQDPERGAKQSPVRPDGMLRSLDELCRQYEVGQISAKVLADHVLKLHAG